jgi:lysophospholipid acyltransferase 7
MVIEGGKNTPCLTYTFNLLLIFMFQYAETEEFYNERSLFYRIWYITPTFFIFRMRIYVGMVLSECVCTMAGLGAYPEFTEPSSGHGPTKAFNKLKEMCVSIEVCLTVLFNL